VGKRKTRKPLAVTAKPKLGPVPLEKLEFMRTPDSRERGDGPGGEAWIILAAGQPAIQPALPSTTSTA